jgi:transposase
MRFVPAKSEQQQSGLMLHRSRRQRTMLSNAIRGHMAQLGIISAKGRNGTADCSRSLRMRMTIACQRSRGLASIVALARRLAVIMHRIWVDGTEFRWTREQAAAAA